ncbi:MAG: Hint domain [Pseudomonadota bacterium]
MSIVTQILPTDVDLIGEPRGFLRGTRLMTPQGWRTVDTLQPGDVVSCCKEEPVTVLRVTRAMVVRTGMKVVAVAGEARGWDRTSAPLLLHTGQMIVVAGDQLAAYFGVEEALAPIGALVNGQDLRLIDAPPADIWYEIETDQACALVVEGLQVAVGQAGRDSRPVLTMAEARLLSLAV